MIGLTPWESNEISLNHTIRKENWIVFACCFMEPFMVLSGKRKSIQNEQQSIQSTLWKTPPIQYRRVLKNASSHEISKFHVVFFHRSFLWNIRCWIWRYVVTSNPFLACTSSNRVVLIHFFLSGFAYREPKLHSGPWQFHIWQRNRGFRCCFLCCFSFRN